MTHIGRVECRSTVLTSGCEGRIRDLSVTFECFPSVWNYRRSFESCWRNRERSCWSICTGWCRHAEHLRRAEPVTFLPTRLRSIREFLVHSPCYDPYVTRIERMTMHDSVNVKVIEDLPPCLSLYETERERRESGVGLRGVRACRRMSRN